MHEEKGQPGVNVTFSFLVKGQRTHFLTQTEDMLQRANLAIKTVLVNTNYTN